MRSLVITADARTLSDIGATISSQYGENHSIGLQYTNSPTATPMIKSGTMAEVVLKTLREAKGEPVSTAKLNEAIEDAGFGSTSYGAIKQLVKLGLAQATHRGFYQEVR